MGLISPEGENLLEFLELRQELSTYDGDLRDPTGGLRKGQSPCEYSSDLRSKSLSHKANRLIGLCQILIKVVYVNIIRMNEVFYPVRK